MGQGFISTPRSRAIDTPSRRALSSIWAVASQTVRSDEGPNFFVGLSLAINISFELVMQPKLLQIMDMDLIEDNKSLVFILNFELQDENKDSVFGESIPDISAEHAIFADVTYPRRNISTIFIHATMWHE
jgi:hypothetical protein